MELEHRDKRDSYVYDPVIKGLDTSFWSAVTGTATVSTGTLVLNAATLASFGLHEFVQEADFMLTIPAIPTSGDARRFGFVAPASFNIGAVYFDTTGTTFSANVYDNSGNHYTLPITWS